MEIAAKRKRAAAYCRVSTGMECQEGSYEIQKSYFTELLSHHPVEELVRVYADEGSGYSTQGRPEFRQMIQDCADGRIDIIYTKSISRFSRNMLDCVTVVRRLKELGIPVIFEKEGINTMDSRSELLFHILAIIAEEESNSISENVSTGSLFLRRPAALCLSLPRSKLKRAKSSKLRSKLQGFSHALVCFGENKRHRSFHPDALIFTLFILRR